AAGRTGLEVGVHLRARVQGERLRDGLPGRAVVGGGERARARCDDECDDHRDASQNQGRRGSGLTQDKPPRSAAASAHASPSSLIIAAPLSPRGAENMIASVGTAAITTAITAAASHGTCTTSGGIGRVALAVSVSAGTMTLLSATPNRAPT